MRRKLTDKSDAPEIVSAKTYFACRRKIAETFGIDPQSLGGAKASFEATILHLQRLIEAGAIGPSLKARSFETTELPNLGIEHFSQEQIIEALAVARKQLLKSGVTKVCRKDLISQARDVLAGRFGLRTTVLKPSAKKGVYRVFNNQLQRFFKRFHPHVQSGGSRPDSMITLIDPDGWGLFEAWERRMRHVIGKADGMLVYDDGMVFVDGTGENLADYSLDQVEAKRRVRDQIEFMRDYLVDISFDGPHFGKVVFELLHYHRAGRYLDGYGIFLDQNDIEGAPSGEGMHFRGTRVNLFCGSLNQVDFASAMSVLPFDRIVIRNRKGENWSKTGIRRTIRTINVDLEFDGFTSCFKEDFCNGEFLSLVAATPWSWAIKK